VSRWENKYVIGLTGNIAVGKSYVRQMLQHLGAYPIDADQLTHQAMAPGAPAYKPVVELFGRFILNDEGQINRARLGSIAFAVPEALIALETAIHPAVRQAIGILVTRAKQSVIVVEAIKLLEGDLAQAVDAVWVVDAPADLQLRRLVEKRKMSLDEARKRIAAQRPQSEKLAQAHVVVTNDGNVEETWRQVQNGWEDIQRLLTPPAPTPTFAPVKPLSISSGLPTPVAQVQPTPVQTAPVAPRQAPTQPVPQPIQPLGTSPAVVAPAAVAPVTAPVGVATRVIDAKQPVIIKRGMPGNAEAIATFISNVSPRQVARMDIMIAFGQKSFLLATGKSEALVGVVGWQVENLITRVDEFYIVPELAKSDILGELIGAVEDASKELQSEVSFVVVPRTVGSELGSALLRRGYRLLKLEEIRFPSWREAAQEMLSIGGADVLIKQLRADRVTKPI